MVSALRLASRKFPKRKSLKKLIASSIGSLNPLCVRSRVVYSYEISNEDLCCCRNDLTRLSFSSINDLLSKACIPRIPFNLVFTTEIGSTFCLVGRKFGDSSIFRSAAAKVSQLAKVERSSSS